MPECTNQSEIAVLCERVSRALDDYQELKRVVEDQNKNIIKLISFQKDIDILNDKVEFLCTVTTSQESKLVAHSTIWKIVSAIVFASLGLIGFGYNTIQSLQSTDRQNENRIVQLEFKTSTMLKRGNLK